MNYYADNSTGPPSYQPYHTHYQQSRQSEDFAPPAGPPPGWGWGQPNSHPPSFTQHNGPGLYQRPNSSHYRSENNYNAPQPQAPNYNNGHLAPYGMNNQHPGQPQQQRPTSASSWHSQPSSPSMSPSRIFPPSMYTWWYSDSSMGTYVEFGTSPKGEPMFSGKLSMSNGHLTLRRDKFKQKGEHLGEAKLVVPAAAQYLIKLPSGQETQFIGKFDYPYRGSTESWSWAGASKSMGDKLSDKLNDKLTGKEKSYQLVGKNTGVVAAILLGEADDYSGSSSSSSASKKHIGRFEFKGPVLSGELGNDFATMAILGFLRVKQKEAEKMIVKAIFKGVSGI